MIYCRLSSYVALSRASPNSLMAAVFMMIGMGTNDSCIIDSLVMFWHLTEGWYTWVLLSRSKVKKLEAFECCLGILEFLEREEARSEDTRLSLGSLPGLTSRDWWFPPFLTVVRVISIASFLLQVVLRSALRLKLLSLIDALLPRCSPFGLEAGWITEVVIECILNSTYASGSLVRWLTTLGEPAATFLALSLLTTSRSLLSWGCFFIKALLLRLDGPNLADSLSFGECDWWLLLYVWPSCLIDRGLWSSPILVWLRSFNGDGGGFYASLCWDCAYWSRYVDGVFINICYRDFL